MTSKADSLAKLQLFNNTWSHGFTLRSYNGGEYNSRKFAIMSQEQSYCTAFYKSLFSSSN